MRRRLLNLLAALSLLLFVSVVALWVRSYFVTEALGFGRIVDSGAAGRTLSIHGVGWGQGRVVLVLVQSLPSEMTPYARRFYLRQPPQDLNRNRPSPSLWNRLGFFLLEPPEFGVIVPLWVLAVATGVLPAYRVAAFARARKRRRTGLCRSCGYDLRATPGRCPECGATAAGQAAATS